MPIAKFYANCQILCQVKNLRMQIPRNRGQLAKSWFFPASKKNDHQSNTSFIFYFSFSFVIEGILTGRSEVCQKSLRVIVSATYITSS